MRLIDADAIPKVSWDQKEEAAFRETINKMPTIEAESVRRGRWIVWYHGEDGFSFNCSECGTPIGWRTNFCPNCGANMDVGKI